MMMIIFTVNNPDFKAGVMALANLLQIQRHDDYLVMLKVSFRVPDFLSSSFSPVAGTYVIACGAELLISMTFQAQIGSKTHPVCASSSR